MLGAPGSDHIIESEMGAQNAETGTLNCRQNSGMKTEAPKDEIGVSGTDNGESADVIDITSEPELEPHTQDADNSQAASGANSDAGSMPIPGSPLADDELHAQEAAQESRRQSGEATAHKSLSLKMGKCVIEKGKHVVSHLACHLDLCMHVTCLLPSTCSCARTHERGTHTHTHI